MNNLSATKQNHNFLSENMNIKHFIVNVYHSANKSDLGELPIIVHN